MANNKSKKKNSKKPEKKTVVKKVAVKKTTKKVVKKTSKKVIKKVTKKTAKKITKKAVKNIPKKAVIKANAKLIPTKTTKPVKMTDYSKAFTPLADRIVVRVTEAEKITAGGIIIPDSASTVSGYLKGEVLAVGTGAKNKKGNIKPLDVKLGDFVLFAQYSGTKIEFNSEELQIVNESEVMGIVQK